MRILRFLITGAVGLTINLGIFHILYTFGIPYLIGSITAFLIALFVGFVLQKFWTFEDRTLTRASSQLLQYATLALINLSLNTLIVYLLVERVGAHYLLAQTAGAAFVATTSYLVYRFYIFSNTV